MRPARTRYDSYSLLAAPYGFTSWRRQRPTFDKQPLSLAIPGALAPSWAALLPEFLRRKPARPSRRCGSKTG